jgi:hypothetical protein
VKIFGNKKESIKETTLGHWEIERIKENSVKAENENRSLRSEIHLANSELRQLRLEHDLKNLKLPYELSEMLKRNSELALEIKQLKNDSQANIDKHLKDFYKQELDSLKKTCREND